MNIGNVSESKTGKFRNLKFQPFLLFWICESHGLVYKIATFTLITTVTFVSD